MATTLFKDRHRYNDNYVTGVLILLIMLAAVAWIKSMMTMTMTSQDSMISLGILVISVGLWWSLRQLKMSLKIKKNKIEYKFSPLHRKKHSIDWRNVDACEIIETPGHLQWAGGNISFEHIDSYSLNGQNGLLIKTKDGRCLFFGSQHIDQLRRVLERHFPDRLNKTF